MGGDLRRERQKGEGHERPATPTGRAVDDRREAQGREAARRERDEDSEAAGSAQRCQARYRDQQPEGEREVPRAEREGRPER